MDAAILNPLLVVIHVLTVVFWIGGVAFVTVIIFPMLMRMEDTLEMVLMFHRLENKFGKHAKIYVAITGITGALLVHFQGREADFFSMRNFGIIAMSVAWLFYLFILLFEKKLFAKIFSKPEAMDGKKVFRFLTGFHWVILAVSLFAVAAGVWQGHGG
jgi:uncharacterized membrane protein